MEEYLLVRLFVALLTAPIPPPVWTKLRFKLDYLTGRWGGLSFLCLSAVLFLYPCLPSRLIFFTRRNIKQCAWALSASRYDVSSSHGVGWGTPTQARNKPKVTTNITKLLIGPARCHRRHRISPSLSPHTARFLPVEMKTESYLTIKWVIIQRLFVSNRRAEDRLELQVYVSRIKVVARGMQSRVE